MFDNDQYKSASGIILKDIDFKTNKNLNLIYDYQNKIEFIIEFIDCLNISPDNESQYINMMNKNFPDLSDNFPDVYDLLASVQSFNDKSNWLVKLNDLTNEVKHNDLYISKVEKEKHTSFKSDDTSMLIVGDMSIQKNGNDYGVFGTGEVYVVGEGNISFYGDGTIQISNGSYDVNNGETNGVKKSVSFINIVKSKKYDEDIISLLKLIIDKEKILVSNIEKYI